MNDKNPNSGNDTGLSAKIEDIHHKLLILVGLLEAADNVMEGVGTSALGNAIFACVNRARLLSRELEIEIGEVNI